MVMSQIWLTTTIGTYYNSFALLHPGVSRDSHFAESSSCTALFYGALTFGPTRLGAATHMFGFKAVLYPSDREIQAGWQQSFKEMNKKWRVGALEKIKINGSSSCWYLHILIWKELVFDLAVPICHARVPLVHESMPILTWEDFLMQSLSDRIFLKRFQACTVCGSRHRGNVFSSWILSAIQRNEHKCC